MAAYCTEEASFCGMDGSMSLVVWWFLVVLEDLGGFREFAYFNGFFIFMVCRFWRLLMSWLQIADSRKKREFAASKVKVMKSHEMVKKKIKKTVHTKTNVGDVNLKNILFSI